MLELRTCRVGGIMPCDRPPASLPDGCVAVALPCAHDQRRSDDRCARRPGLRCALIVLHPGGWLLATWLLLSYMVLPRFALCRSP